MQKIKFSIEEVFRIKALESYSILDTCPDVSRLAFKVIGKTCREMKIRFLLNNSLKQNAYLRPFIALPESVEPVESDLGIKIFRKLPSQKVQNHIWRDLQDQNFEVATSILLTLFHRSAFV